MRRKFTVYGLRFSKTTFWNRLNTGFLEPAVATALTACGIETLGLYAINIYRRLIVATALTACGIETCKCHEVYIRVYNVLQQHLPLAVLKRTHTYITMTCNSHTLQQHLPLAVLKQYHVGSINPNSIESCNSTYRLRYWNLIILDDFWLQG